MPHGLLPFLIQWAVTTLLLWVASHIFKGITYTSPGALWVAALLLGLVLIESLVIYVLLVALILFFVQPFKI